MHFISKAVTVTLLVLSFNLSADNLDTLGQPPLVLQLDTTLCTGEILGGMYSQAGTYIDTISNSTGLCDSLILITILEYFEPTPDVITNLNICEGEQFTDPFTEILIDQNGCPYTNTLILTVFPTTPDVVTNETVCDEGQTSGTFIQVSLDANGCEYNNILNLMVLPTTPDVITDAEICDGDSIVWNNQTITEIGSYNIEFLDANGCPYTETLRVFEAPSEDCLSSTKDQFNGIDINIYPNPASEYLIVESLGSSQESLELELTDAQGQAIYSTLIKESKFQIDISTLPTGVYVTKINSEKSNEVKVITFLKN